MGMYPTSPSSKSIVRAVLPAAKTVMRPLPGDAILPLVRAWMPVQFAQATGLQGNDCCRNRGHGEDLRIDDRDLAATSDLGRLHRARLKVERFWDRTGSLHRLSLLRLLTRPSESNAGTMPRRYVTAFSIVRALAPSP